MKEFEFEPRYEVRSNNFVIFVCEIITYGPKEINFYALSR